jgi:hypothetical protein
LREPQHFNRAPRVAANHRATLVDENGREVAGIVIDISKSGFRIQTEEPLMVGECVRLRDDSHGDYAAQIRWVDGHEAGGVFLESVAFD